MRARNSEHVAKDINKREGGRRERRRGGKGLSETKNERKEKKDGKKTSQGELSY